MSGLRRLEIDSRFTAEGGIHDGSFQIVIGLESDAQLVGEDFRAVMSLL